VARVEKRGQHPLPDVRPSRVTDGLALVSGPDTQSLPTSFGMVICLLVAILAFDAACPLSLG
jgi:hypothetical protein